MADVRATIVAAARADGGGDAIDAMYTAAGFFVPSEANDLTRPQLTKLYRCACCWAWGGWGACELGAGQRPRRAHAPPSAMATTPQLQLPPRAPPARPPPPPRHSRAWARAAC